MITITLEISTGTFLESYQQIPFRNDPYTRYEKDLILNGKLCRDFVDTAISPHPHIQKLFTGFFAVGFYNFKICGGVQQEGAKVRDKLGFFLEPY